MSRQNPLPEMATTSNARVGIVIPVYNGARYLEECLASIASQTYCGWEAVVVNNCSTDGTAGIAEAFAARDSRFRVVNCTEFLPKSENYNRAVASVSAGIEFVKIVEADNYIWPESLERMLDLATADPGIGLVGSYHLYGRKVFGEVIDVKRTVFLGNEVRRDHLLTDVFYLGVPTVMLFRAKALSEITPYFRSGLFFDDIELYFRVLDKWKYGFVHQILTFVRDDNGGVFTDIRNFEFHEAYRYVLTMQFGPDVLEPDELSKAREKWKREYLQCLAHAAIAGRSEQYWEFQKRVFHLIGEELGYRNLVGPVVTKLIEMLLNPKSTIEGLLRRLRRHGVWA